MPAQTVRSFLFAARTYVCCLIAVCTTFCVTSCVLQPARAADNREAAEYTVKVEKLENGATIVLKPIPDLGKIAVESIFRVGFIDEPKGMCQASHLLEHLICYSPTKSFAAKEAFDRVQKLGMVNAETLPDWTHYDYVVPSDQLDLVLQIETERLTSLEFSESDIARETPRIYQETDFVEKNPQSGMLKHAFMAFSQVWHGGDTTALVRGGLDQIPLDRLREFHSSTYRPDRMTFIIAGDFDEQRVLSSVRQTLGSVKNQVHTNQPAIDWNKLPLKVSVDWDTSLNAICLYYPPPENARDRMVLSHLGTLWNSHLGTDTALKKSTEMVMSSSVQWAVGEIPFFVYAAAKPGVPLDQVESELKAVATRFLVSPASLNQIQASAPFILRQLQSCSGANFDQTVQKLAKLQKADRDRAVSMALAHSAIEQFLLRKLNPDADDAGLADLKQLKSSQLTSLMERSLKPANQRVIRLHAAKSL